MPVAPAVSAVRITAPRFCGSVTPSSATRKAAGSASIASRSAGLIGAANATTPWGALVRARRSSWSAGTRRTRRVGFLGKRFDLFVVAREPHLVDPPPPATRAPAPHGDPRSAVRGRASRPRVCPRRRASAGRDRAGSSMPDGAARPVLELDAARGQLVADPVARGEVPGRARPVALADQCVDLRVVARDAPRSRLRCRGRRRARAPSRATARQHRAHRRRWPGSPACRPRRSRPPRSAC